VQGGNAQMSLYQVNKFIHRMVKDKSLFEKLKLEPAVAFENFNLKDEEKSALASLDSKKLSKMGVHPILLVWCQLLQGRRDLSKIEES
jgi:hypothetical protein